MEIKNFSSPNVFITITTETKFRGGPKCVTDWQIILVQDEDGKWIIEDICPLDYKIFIGKFELVDEVRENYLRAMKAAMKAAGLDYDAKEYKKVSKALNAMGAIALAAKAGIKIEDEINSPKLWAVHGGKKLVKYLKQDKARNKAWLDGDDDKGYYFINSQGVWICDVVIPAGYTLISFEDMVKLSN